MPAREDVRHTAPEMCIPVSLWNNRKCNMSAAVGFCNSTVRGVPLGQQQKHTKKREKIASKDVNSFPQPSPRLSVQSIAHGPGASRVRADAMPKKRDSMGRKITTTLFFSDEAEGMS